MTGPGKYRKKPVVIDAIRYIDYPTNGIEVATWSMDNIGDSNFSEIHPDDRGDDPDQTAEVWDKLHGTWVGVYDGQWIIRGIKGEYYPCAHDVFLETYEPADRQPGEKIADCKCACCGDADECWCGDFNPEERCECLYCVETYEGLSA